ncbi:hypothetical protein [Thermobrachium celere]|nr:hypothetical protein [Thermobrachium celere]
MSGAQTCHRSYGFGTVANAYMVERIEKRGHLYAATQRSEGAALDITS